MSVGCWFVAGGSGCTRTATTTTETFFYLEANCHIVGKRLVSVAYLHDHMRHTVCTQPTTVRFTFTQSHAPLGTTTVKLKCMLDPITKAALHNDPHVHHILHTCHASGAHMARMTCCFSPKLPCPCCPGLRNGHGGYEDGLRRLWFLGWSALHSQQSGATLETSAGLCVSTFCTVARGGLG